MLKSVTLKNFKSYMDETKISFEKTKYEYLEKNVYNGILKGAFFIGDNGSGKSNVLKAIRFIIDLLEGNNNIIYPFYVRLFSKETEIKYNFYFNGKNIYYVIIFDSNGIKEEHLLKENKEILTRIASNGIVFINEKKVNEKIEDSNVSLLRKMSVSGVVQDDADVKYLIEFIKNSNYIDSYSKDMSHKVNDYIKKYGDNYLNNFLKEINSPLEIKNTTFHEKDVILCTRSDMEKIILPLELESTGNQALINVLPTIIDSSTKNGMIVIDEFSAGMHINLEMFLVKFMMNKKFMSQLFLSSHCAGLISNTIFRPDQIYVVSFEKNKGSKVSRVSDFSPRVFQNLQKMYLSGEFGGLPKYEAIER